MESIQEAAGNIKSEKASEPDGIPSEAMKPTTLVGCNAHATIESGIYHSIEGGKLVFMTKKDKALNGSS